jgi:hypothetical protein
MNDRMTHRTTGYEAQRRLAAESLKRCPLCGAVNALANGECFVCRWSGAFDRDPDHVEQGLCELLDRCPELADAMMEAPVRREPILKRWTRRICALFSFRKRIDILV